MSPGVCFSGKPSWRTPRKNRLAQAPEPRLRSHHRALILGPRRKGSSGLGKLTKLCWLVSIHAACVVDGLPV